MKFIFIFLTVVFFSCKNKNESAPKVKEVENIIGSNIEKKAVFGPTKQGIDFSFIDSLESINLPIGDKNLKEYTFATDWNFGDLYDNNREISIEEKQILSFTRFVTYESSESSKKYQSRINKFYKQKNDYRFLLFDFDQYYDFDIARYSNKNDSIKVILIGFNKDEILPQKEFPLSVSYRDLLTIKGGKVLGILNIDNFFGNYSLGGQYRKFYVDSNYIIHIKDFDHGENQGNFIRSEKWKIKNNGQIVRYHAQKDTILTTGKVKGHLRDGNWIEINPDPNIALKNKELNIEGTRSYAEGEYNEGEKVDEWKYYSIERNKKGALVYTEIYKDGMMLKRKFVKN